MSQQFRVTKRKFVGIQMIDTKDEVVAVCSSFDNAQIIVNHFISINDNPQHLYFVEVFTDRSNDDY